MTTSIATIEECAFTVCGVVAALIIRPVGDVAADVEGGDANNGPWSALAGNGSADDDEAEEDAPDFPSTTISRVWAQTCHAHRMLRRGRAQADGGSGGDDERVVCRARTTTI